MEYFARTNPICAFPSLLSFCNTNTKAGSTTSPKSQYNISQLNSSANLLQMELKFSSFSESKGMKLKVGLTPQNGLKATNGSKSGPAVPLCLSYPGNIVQFKQGEEIGKEEVSVILVSRVLVSLHAPAK
jgi:hypothetical protein